MKISKKEHEEFIEAAAGVYTWIISSDGDVTKSEHDGFLTYLNSLDYIDEITNAEFLKKYEILLEYFKQDFDDGIKVATTNIEKFKGNSKISEDLIHVARKALIGDDAFHDVEENVMSEIARILAVDESQIK